MADLDGAKQRLVEALKDRIQRYWELLKSWYRRRISKDDFDTKAKSLLGEENIQLHNEFLFAILVKCQTGGQPDVQPAAMPYAQFPVSGKPPKPKKLKLESFPEHVALPYGVLNTQQYHTPPRVQIIGRDLDSILLCSHELMLPDLTTLHTRMLLGAWEAGLEGVSEEAAQLLMLAIEYHLKTVIQSLMVHRSSWKLRYGRFQHSFGSGLASRALPTMATPTPASLGVYPGEVTEAEEALMAAQSVPVKQLKPLTLFHMRDALQGCVHSLVPRPFLYGWDKRGEGRKGLVKNSGIHGCIPAVSVDEGKRECQVNRHCIPVHTVYACNMERVLAGMWHPSREEEEQQKAVEQWRRTLEQPVPFAITATHRL